MKPALQSVRSATVRLSLADLAASPRTSVPLVAGAGAVLGIAVVAKPMLVLGMAALVLALLAAAVAVVRPGLAFAGLVAMMAFIPSYASPSVGPLLFMPAAAVSWLIAITLLWRNTLTEGAPLRVNYVDLAVAAFVGLMTISLSFSLRTEINDLVRLMFLWAGPYLAVRTLLAQVESPVELVAKTFAGITLILAPIAVSEALGGSNPFFNLDFNSGEFSIWASQIDRFGAIRAVTSFGHPIAFSMFLAATALLAVAMGIASTRTRSRLAWYAVSAVAVGTMSFALSRTGWLMVATGVVMLALVTVRGPARTRLLTLFGIIVAVVVITSLVMPNELSVLPGVGHTSESTYRTSGLYREALLDRALEPGVLHLWGNAHNAVTPYVNFGTATDNAYIILADTWGLIPTFALFAVAATMLVAVARAYGLPGEPIAILPIIGFTCMVAIFFVAFITQQQLMIWMMIGAAGCGAERITRQRRRRRGGRAAVDPGS